MHPVIVQMLWYLVVIVLAFFLIGVLLKGFFWPYIRVRLSFGKKILIKIRALPVDYFKVGDVEGNFLVFKHKSFMDSKKRQLVFNIEKNDIYRWLAVACIDLDLSKGAILKYDYTGVSGYDAEKHAELLERALYRPTLTDDAKKLQVLMVVSILTGIICLVLCFLVYTLGTKIDLLAQV